ncbi:MAG: tol-pal system protein YbgF [Desulfovibrionaceae bacterium]
MRWIQKILVLGIIMLCAACANRKLENRVVEAEHDAVATRTDMQELEQSVRALDKRIDELSTEVTSLEVKTLRGKKTQYMVVPTVKAGSYKPLEAAPSGGLASTKSAPAPVASAVPASSATVTRAAPSPSSSPAPVAPPTPAPPASPQAPSDTFLALPPTAASAPSAKPAPVPNLSASAPSASAPVAAATSPPTTPVPVQSAVSLALPPEKPTAGHEPSATALATTALTPAPVSPPVAAARGAAEAPLAPKMKGEESAYSAALALARGGQSAEAIKRFNAFLQEFPSGRYAPNAYYWIGECLYAQRNYADALLQFKEVASRYPRHHKSADALLKAGMTYTRLGDKDNAVLQYKAVLADFPASEAARYVKGRGLAR